MATKKLATSYRISDEARDLLRRVAEAKGVSQHAILELAIREYAEKKLKKK